MSQAGNYPDCELCEYMLAAGESAQAQSTANNTARDAIALLRRWSDSFINAGYLSPVYDETVAYLSSVAQQHP